jgi:hypothetical protein
VAGEAGTLELLAIEVRQVLLPFRQLLGVVENPGTTAHERCLSAAGGLSSTAVGTVEAVVGVVQVGVVTVQFTLGVVGEVLRRIGAAVERLEAALLALRGGA